MRLADPTWLVTTTDGQILAQIYHRSNAETEARARARIMGEPMHVKQWTDAGLVLRAVVEVPR